MNVEHKATEWLKINARQMISFTTTEAFRGQNDQTQGFGTSAPLYTYLVANPNDVRSKLIKKQTAGTESGYYPAKYPSRKGNNQYTASEPYEGYTDVASVILEKVLFERRVELFAENSMAFDYWRYKMSVKISM